MLATLVLAGVLAAAPEAGHPIEIEWSAPAACPDAAWAHDEVERFVGDELSRTRATQLSFQVEIATSTDAGFVAEIVTVTEGGQRRRRLPHSDCQRLSQAAALIIALAIDPASIAAVDEETLEAIASAEDEASPDEPEDAPDESNDESGTEPETEDEPRPLAPTAGDPDPTEPDPPESTRRLRPWWGAARLAFDLGVGRLPTVDVGGTLGVTVGGGPLRIEVLGGAWAPRSVVVEQGRGVFWTWAIAGRVGAAIPLGRRVELPILAGIDVGQIRAAGRGLLDAGDAAPIVGHVHLVPGATVWVHGNVGLLVEADLFVPWSRPSFSVAGHGRLYRAPPVGIHPAIGILGRIPARRNGSRPKRKL